VARIKYLCLHNKKCKDALCPHRKKHEVMVGKEKGCNSCETLCDNGGQFAKKLFCEVI